MGTLTFGVSVSSINIPAKVGARNWRLCLLEAFEQGTLTVANEAGKPAQRDLYRRMAIARGRSTYGNGAGPNVLFADQSLWKWLGGRRILLHRRGHGWRAARYPGFNGPRYATVSTYRSVPYGDTVPKVALIGTHLVPRGWKVPAGWRDRVRRRSIAKLTALVEAYRAAGYIVIICGDMNMPHPPAIAGVSWVSVGVDMIGVAVPRGVTVQKPMGRKAFLAPTDHKHGVAAHLVFSYNPVRSLVHA